MAPPDRQLRPQFSQPVRQILSMLMVLGLSGSGVFVALPQVLSSISGLAGYWDTGLSAG